MPPNGAAGSPPYNLRKGSTARQLKEQEYEEARVTFDKTISGHYRHGKTGYGRVGVLFLTWEDDDMNCKETEVDNLKKVFQEKFQYETFEYVIPSERWQTGLLKTLSEFMWKFDSPDCLAILYYAGHGYEGTETKQFKLSAKAAADSRGDPSVFFNDIRTVTRAPTCDQLMIVDCCYAARAFAREHIGKRKFELLTSAAHDAQSDAPHLDTSFTRKLNDALPRLLDQNPNGFSTAHLFREVYHDIPTIKPQLFDQSRHSLGKIWLRPQASEASQTKETNSTHVAITLRLTERPTGVVMNELASNLQYLPHVNEVRVKELYAPTDQLTDFMRFVLQAQKLRPLLRRLHAKRQIKKMLQTLNATNEEGSGKDRLPSHLVDLHLSHKDRGVYDWSSARRYPKRGWEDEDLEIEQNKRKRSCTWPAKC